jgi:alpha-L-fucosidase
MTIPAPGTSLRPEQEAFKDLKFGMFVHWSLFSLPTGHQRWKTPEGAAQQFMADRFDAGQWLDVAEGAGARYITFTAKHHDGFCLFSSQLTEFCSAKTPARKDFVGLLSDECRRRGMPLFIYYSLPDLHHPGFTPGQPDEWEGYIEYYQGQIAELSTNYGRVAGFWLDPGPWHGPDHDYRLTRTETIIKELQPHALVMGRDFYEAEKNAPNLPGTLGYLDDHGEGIPREMPAPSPGNWPFEVCDTMNDSWQYNESDTNFKSPDSIIRKLVSIVGTGGNYLLNVSPMASGEVDSRQVGILQEVGAWLDAKGDSVYGTRPFIPPTRWGVAVSRDNTAYLHVMTTDDVIMETPVPGGGLRSFGLMGGEGLRFTRKDSAIEIHVPPASRDGIDTVITAELDRESG